MDIHIGDLVQDKLFKENVGIVIARFGTLMDMTIRYRIKWLTREDVEWRKDTQFIVVS